MVSNKFFPTLWFLQIYYYAKVSSESYEITVYFKYYETYCNILCWKLFQIDDLSACYRGFFFGFQDHLFGLCCLGCINDLPIWLFISVSILLVTCSFISYWSHLPLVWLLASISNCTFSKHRMIKMRLCYMTWANVFKIKGRNLF